MNRRTFAWSVTSVAREGDYGSGVKFAHNSALSAGVAQVRAIARAEGQTYSRGDVVKGDGATAVAWHPDRIAGPVLVVRVREVTS